MIEKSSLKMTFPEIRGVTRKSYSSWKKHCIAPDGLQGVNGISEP